MRYAPLAILVVVLIGAALLLWRGRAREAATAPPTPFRMPVDDAFALKQPGKVVVVGVVAEGEVRPGTRLLLRTGADELPVSVEGLEAFHRPLRVARQGDRVGIMLVGAGKEQVPPGAVLVSVGD